MTYVVPPLLESILADANALAPHRRRNSDGTVGDLAHQQRDSDHNPAPDPGTSAPLIVHACDVSQSVPGNPFCTPATVNFAVPGSVFNAHAWGDIIAARIAAGLEHRVKYLVSHNYTTGRAKIFDPSVSMTWRDQDGDDHLSHLHTSIVYSHAVEQSTAPYFQEDEMPLTDADVAHIAAALAPLMRAEAEAAVKNVFGGYPDHQHYEDGAMVTQLRKQLGLSKA